MTRARRGLALGAGFVLALSACAEEANIQILEVDATGTVVGALFQDLNGSGQPEQNGDAAVQGWTVKLRQPAGGVLGTAVTDTAGVFQFDQIPVGRAVLEFDQALLGDTVELFGIALEPFTLGNTQSVTLAPGVRFFTYTVPEVRALPAGRPLFTEGIALNTLTGLVRELHILGSGGYVRILNVVGQVQPGDSVRIRGRTTQDVFQPVLGSAVVFDLGNSALPPDAVELSTGDADGALGGTLDAAFVVVRDAQILEVDDQDEDGIKVMIDDGSGPMELRFRDFLNMDPDVLIPDTIFVERARGLLVPYDDAGDIRWRLLPRVGSDLRLDETVFPAGTAKGPEGIERPNGAG